MQHLLSDNANELVNAIRGNRDGVKASICDAFANVAFLCGDGKEAWQVMQTLQEYTHLVNALSCTDKELSNQ